jgi:apolipoprotein D and lipocalin family protein
MLLVFAVALLLNGCQSMPPIRTVDQVSLDRFMGKWYVIASIPTFIEKDAYNAVERYELDENGHVRTTFTFNKGGFDGPLKTYRPVGFVRDPDSNAVWDMQFLWPFKAEYRILYLDEAYNQTVIGRTKRDFVWIMAREPAISESDYDRLVRFVEEQGYDVSQLVRIPHQ